MKVKVGQVWQYVGEDSDREVRVVEVTDTHAMVTGVDGKRPRKILLAMKGDEQRIRGYRLARQAPAKLKPEVKAEFVAALRGGKYPQGKHALRVDTGFCCLGVLCDLSVAAGIGRWEPRFGDWHFVPEEGQDEEYSLPVGVIRWAFEELDPDVYPDTNAVSNHLSNPDVWTVQPHLNRPLKANLAELNDSGNFDFGAIADIVEEQL